MDSYSLNKEILSSNDESCIKKIIRYSQYQYFEIRRSPYNTNSNNLNSINPYYKMTKDFSRNNNIIIGEKSDDESYKEIIHFNIETIEMLADLLYRRKLNKDEFESIVWLFVNQSLSQNRMTFVNKFNKQVERKCNKEL